MIKAVLFDIDGVLVDSFEANLKFYQDLLSKAGYSPPTRKQFSKLFHSTMFDVIKTITKSTSEKEIQKIWEMGNRREVRYPLELLSTPLNLEKTLLRLHKTYSLGIVTSRIKNGVFEIPQLAKLQHIFSTVVTYEDTTNHKPHPEPLLLAIHQLGIHPDDAIYIGDLNNDIQAAKAANMKIIMYSKSTFANADACTSSFKDLPALIATI